VALGRLEVGQKAGPPGDRLAALLDLDLAVGHHEPCPLVHLMLLQRLTGRQVDRDHAALVVRAQHLRAARKDLERRDVPSVHG
jgi:hypothetical protein